MQEARGKVIKKIELPISHKYVQKWTPFEAIRELFQNAIDRAKEGEDYAMSYSYHRDDKMFMIQNTNTKLAVKSLILGNSDKEENDEAIGKFGEGYKLALLVFLRNGYTVIIENQDEIWVPRLEYSEQYETKILSVTVYKYPGKKPGNALTFSVKGIRPNLFKSYHRYNLLLQGRYKADETSRGEVLYDERHKGKVFVEGLYVTEIPNEFYYGYNFNAGVIPLDRDRTKLSSFDVAWECEAMLRELSPDKNEEIVELLESDSRDVSYLLSNGSGTPRVKELAEVCYGRFRQQYGDCVPVRSEYEKDNMRREYENIRCAVVNEKVVTACKLSDSFTQDFVKYVKRVRLSPEEICVKFLEDNKPDFSPSLASKYYGDVIKQSKNWGLES